jgi:hypothetical protein
MKRRVAYGVAVMLGLTVLLVIALATGVKAPGRSLRIYLAAVGVVGCSLAISWLRHPEPGKAPKEWKPRPDRHDRWADRLARNAPGQVADSSDADGSQLFDPDEIHPAFEEIEGLAGRIRFGTRQMTDYNRFVRPRLTGLARSCLARHGINLDDSQRAEAVLGPSYRLVDPRRRTESLPTGVRPAEVSELLDLLERL